MKKSKFLRVILFFTILVSITTISKATNEKYQTFYDTVKSKKQETLEQNPYSINIEDGIKKSNQKKYAALKESMQSKYFLADDIKVNVKNQGATSSCWAFTAISSLETNMTLKNKINSIYSVKHMEYATSRTFKNNTINKIGFNREVADGGNFKVAFSYFTNGTGPVLEKDMPFDGKEDKIDISEINNKTVDRKITDYAEFSSLNKEYDSNGKISEYNNGYSGEYKIKYTQEQVDILRTQIKKHIKENGAVTAFTYAAQDSEEEFKKYYNADKVSNGECSTYAYYCNESSKIPDHAITIVGWDDNYSKTNFSIEPKNDGAYIVLNSWGDKVLNGGYMYVSYDDANIETGPMGIITTDKVDYDTIYQYDEYGPSLSLPFNNTTTGEALNAMYAANVFERDSSKIPTDGKQYDEYINEISFYTSQTSDIQVLINSESEDLEKVQLVATPGVLEPGYHTVKLSTPIKLTGDKFAIAVRYSNNDGVEIPFEFNYKTNLNISNYWDYVTSEKGESYIAINTRIMDRYDGC